MATPREPQPGDLIEISHTGYAHWALYVGDGYVVHLAPPDGRPGIASAGALSVDGHAKGVVRRELLEGVARGCPYKVNNRLDHGHEPQPVAEILKSAEETVGRTMEYNVLSRNCEHFVTDLRYGKARSRQVEHLLLGASILSAVLGIFGLAAIKM